ncbi:MAG: hypothetical protein WKF34_09940 [Pyrinomonadaceae bacterium]
MKKVLILTAFLAAFSVAVFPQDGPPIMSTSTVDGARFEMVQPSSDRNLTFRLDKFTGVVHRLAACPKDDSVGSDRCWKEMVVLDLPKSLTNRIRFQIVVNGAALRNIFLLQIETGKTWQYGIEREDKWHPFIECNDRTNPNCSWRP